MSDQETKLFIEKMPDGGFVITNSPPQYGLAWAALYACSTIDEVIDYIKGKLA